MEEARFDRGGGISDIQILGATVFDDVLASEQILGTFLPQRGRLYRGAGNNRGRYH
jgi:hypothetical protein